MDIVEKRRRGKRMFAPVRVRDCSPSVIGVGCPPSKRAIACVIQRARGPLITCTRLTWSVLIGRFVSTRIRSPRTSLNAPVFHAVSTSPSKASAARSSGV